MSPHAFDNLFRRFLAELEIRRCLKAGRNCACPFVSDNQHRLAGYIAGTALWADVIGRRQGQLIAVTETRMVAGVIVGIAAKDVEHEPSVQFVQRRLRRVESVPDDFREVFIAGGIGHGWSPTTGLRLSPPSDMTDRRC